MAVKKLWQYQAYSKPVPVPGSEAETVYFGAWQQLQNEPRRNFSARKIAVGICIAAAPFFFTTESQAAETVYFGAWQQPQSQPYRNYAVANLQRELRVDAPHFFFQETQASVAQVSDPIYQPRNRVPSRLHGYPNFFFQENPAAAPPQISDAIVQRRNAVPSRTHVVAPYFFFENQVDYVGQAVDSTVIISSRKRVQYQRYAEPVSLVLYPRDHVTGPSEQPRRWTAARPYLRESLFFSTAPIVVVRIPDPIVQPGPRLQSRKHLAQSFFFQEQAVTLPVSLVEAPDSRPVLGRKDYRHLYSSFFMVHRIVVPRPSQEVFTSTPLPGQEVFALGSVITDELSYVIIGGIILPLGAAGKAASEQTGSTLLNEEQGDLP